MTSKRLAGLGIASVATTAAVAVAGLGLAGTAGASSPSSSAASGKIKKAEIRVRGNDDVRMKVKTSRGVDKVTFTYAGETYRARRSHETPNEWQRTVDRDMDATKLAFSVTACDGSDCVTKSYSGSGDRVRSGSDDGANHDAGDDKGGRSSGSSSGSGSSGSGSSGSSGSGSSGSGSSGRGGADDGPNHDAGDDHGGRHGGHGSDD